MPPSQSGAPRGGLGFGSGLLGGLIAGSLLSGGSQTGSFDYDYGYGGGRRGCGGTGCLFSLIAAILVASLAVGALSTCLSPRGQRESTQSNVIIGQVTPDAQASGRTPLSPTQSTETAWYQDDDGDWIGDASLLERGLKDFYERTGVRPYVHILPNGQLRTVSACSQLADEEYDQLFTDEGHFLLVFCDDGHGSYNCGYVCGSDAAAIMDDEALDILASRLDRWYFDDSVSEEEIFSRAFSETARQIM